MVSMSPHNYVSSESFVSHNSSSYIVLQQMQQLSSHQRSIAQVNTPSA